MSLLAGCAARLEPAAAPMMQGPGHLFRPTAGPVIASPLVADLDRDGSLDIAVGSWDGYFYVTDVGLRDRPGWPRYSPKGFFSSPAAADVDGDDRLELFVGSEAGRLFGWRADGSNLPGWPVNLRHRLWASPTILPGNRIAILVAWQMFVLDARGRPVRGWPQPALGWGDATAATDGHIIAVATLTEGVPPTWLGLPDRGAVHAWRMDGTALPGFPVRLSKDADSSPALADLNGDGENDIVVGDDAGLVHVLDQRGRPLPGWPQQTDSLVEASPAIGDLDGDGSPDVVVGSWDGKMYAWDARGRLLPGWPQAAGDQFISSAALVDLNDDGLPDVVAGSKDHLLYGWDGRGAMLPGFSVDLGAAVFSSPWIGDLDGNGRADIVVGANNGIHMLHDVGPLGRAAWPKFHFDDRNTGWPGGAP
ncbi:MAG: FG-GAP repeat domain-containing protein [Anaerolineae bacterium]